jgi:large subunit ribosomal protein L10
MNRDQKASVVEELTEQIRSAEAIFAVDYRGITVSDVAELRAKLRDAQAKFRIVKNSLTERASDAAGTEALRPLLEGPTALTFVAGDAALAAKALNDAARNLGTLEFKGGLMNGSALTADEVRTIARLPSREVLHGQLVGTIAAPLSGLVRTLNALIAGLAIQLGSIADQGLVTGEAPSASEAPEVAADEAGAADPDPSASAADAAPPQEAAPQSEAAPESEDESASEALGPEVEAEQSGPEAHSASEPDTPEDDASAEAPQAEEPKEEA